MYLDVNEKEGREAIVLFEAARPAAGVHTMPPYTQGRQAP